MNYIIINNKIYIYISTYVGCGGGVHFLLEGSNNCVMAMASGKSEW